MNQKTGEWRLKRLTVICVPRRLLTLRSDIQLPVSESPLPGGESLPLELHHHNYARPGMNTKKTTKEEQVGVLLENSSPHHQLVAQCTGLSFYSHTTNPAEIC